MTTRRNFVLCLAILFACPHAAAAQQPRRGGRSGRAARANAPAAPPVNAPRAARAPAWSITTQPFAEDGETTTLVSLQPMPTAAAADKQPPLNIGVNFTYEGGTPANFKNVTLNFFSRAATCRFAAEPAVVLNLDNRPLTLSFRPQARGADGVFWVERSEEGGDCAETVVAYVSPATLARIAAARSVTGRLDQEAFQLTADNLAALRALLAQLRLPQLRNAMPTARARARR